MSRTSKPIHYRFYGDQSDLDGLWQVWEASKEADQVVPYSTVDGYPTLKSLAKDLIDDHCVPSRDVRIAEVKGEVVGYARVCWWTETDGTWLFLHNEFVKPDYREQGVMESLMKWAEERIRVIAQGFPTNGKAVFGTNATSTEPFKTELILKAGYRQTFTMVELEKRLDEPVATVPFPEGFELRPVQSDQIRLIWEANNAVYTNRSFISTPTETDYQEFLGNPLNDYSLWTVAWYQNAITGLVLSQIENGLGEVTEVGVLESYRRQGLAYALLTENLNRLQHRGVSVVRLHTSGENVSGAKSLYEKVGFKVLKTYARYRKKMEF